MDVLIILFSFAVKRMKVPDGLWEGKKGVSAPLSISYKRLANFNRI